MKRKLIGMYRRQRGITGLETAIILIAFVVVASVFAYTVLSAGLFSTEKSQESIHAGLEEAQSTLQIRGSVTAYADARTEVESSVYRNIDSNGDSAVDDATNDDIAISKIEFMVTVVEGGDMVDLTPPWEGTGVTAATMPSAQRSDSVTQITYSDQSTIIQECAWTVVWVGNENGDYILDPGEKAIITVYLVWDDSDFTGWALGTDDNDPFMDSSSALIGTNHKFTLEVKPSKGAVLTIERTTPGYLDNTNDLS